MSNQVSSLKMEKKFKKTPIGEIPVDWGVATIGECAIINSTSLTEQTPLESKFRYIDISSIEHTGRITEIREVTFKNAPSRARRVVKAGDILVSTVRPYLKAFAKVNFQGSNLIASTGFAVITPKPDTNGDYLYQFILSDSFVKFLAERMVGSNYPAVSAGDVAASLLPLPPIHEQEKIAEILSSVDDAIEKTTAVIEKNKELKKGLMQQLLTRGIGHSKFKKTPIGEIPVDWGVANLENVAQINMGQSPLSASCFDYENGLPFFQGKAEFGMKYPTTTKWCNSPTKIAENGDILITVRAPVGDVNIAPERCCIGRGLAAIRGIKSDNDFLYFIMIFLKESLSKIGQGSTFEAINKDVLFKLKLPLPPLPEQKKIAEILSSVDDQIVQENTIKQQLEQTKRALMQVLLTGKVRVKTDG